MIFVHIPKCGGKSILKDLYGLGEHDFFGHKRIGFYERLLGPRAFARTPSFAMLRDPVDRCVSGFAFSKRGGFGLADDARRSEHLAGLDFDSFVRDGHLARAARDDIVFRPQSFYLTFPDGRFGVDRLLRFENFAEELQGLPDVGKRFREVSHLNAAPKGTPVPPPVDVVTVIHEVYAEDVRLLKAIGRDDRNR